MKGSNFGEERHRPCCKISFLRVRLEIAEFYDESLGSIILRKLYDNPMNRESLFINAYCREGCEIVYSKTRSGTCTKRRNLAPAAEDHSLQLDVVGSGEQEARNPRVVGDDKRCL